MTALTLSFINGCVSKTILVYDKEEGGEPQQERELRVERYGDSSIINSRVQESEDDTQLVYLEAIEEHSEEESFGFKPLFPKEDKQVTSEGSSGFKPLYTEEDKVVSKREDCIDCVATVPLSRKKIKIASQLEEIESFSTQDLESYAEAEVSNLNYSMEEMEQVAVEEGSGYYDDSPSMTIVAQNSYIENESEVYESDVSDSPFNAMDKVEEEMSEPIFVAESSEIIESVDRGNTVEYFSSNDRNIEPTIEEISNKIAIQVGAFREYAGAKVYAKKYDLLSDQYNVEIQENIKDDLPLYRVRIEGFTNEFEAQKFITRYELNGAFLVRK